MISVKMNHSNFSLHQMSTNMNQKDKVEWRRNKVQELLVKGYHYEIASSLQISRLLQEIGVIRRDIF